MTADGNIDVPLAKLHDVSQKEHAAAGFVERETLQEAAAFAQVLYTYLFCWEPKELTTISETIATTASATLIMMRYSREPCALGIIG